MIAQTVHTTGVNVEGVLAIGVELTIILTFFAAIITFLVRRGITDAVRVAMEPIEARLDEHDNRLSRLEGMEEGKRMAIAQAGVSTTQVTP